MTEPAVPSPAATLLLLRDRAGGGVEALLVQRNAGSRFAAGDYVFAGGRVEPGDTPADVEGLCRGLTREEAARRVGGGVASREALGFWVAAIREAFEEVGVLLAYTPEGTLVGSTAGSRERYAAHRRACQADHAAFLAMLRAEGLRLATDRLTYFAHWITPEESPIRFDTRFFAALMPAEQQVAIDGREIVSARWLTLGEALAARARNEISLRFPTVRNLELASAGPTAADSVARLRDRPVPTIRPRILMVDGRPVPVLPGDPRWF